MHAGTGPKIRFHAWGGGEDRLILDVPGAAPLPGLEVSPDGKTLLYSRNEQTESDLLTVELWR